MLQLNPTAAEWLSSPDGLQEYDRIVDYQVGRRIPYDAARDAASEARAALLFRNERLPPGYHVHQLRLRTKGITA